MRTEAREALIKDLPEAEYNLAVFDKHVAEHGPASFMVLKVGGGVLNRLNMLEACVGSIARLGRLGFSPVIVHGGGPQINQRLDQLGIRKSFPDGLRVTPKEAIWEIVDVLDGINEHFVDRLEEHGQYAKGFPRAFEADYIDRQKYGEVGAVTNFVDAQNILSALEDGRIPVISCLGRLASGEGFLNINADDAAAYVVKILRPLKYVSMTLEGGVTDDKETIIPVITPEMVKDLENRGLLVEGKQKKVKEGLALVNSGVASDVVIVHPAKLIEELFTHEGHGTLVTSDVPLRTYEMSAINSLDTVRISKLIEEAFDKKLAPDYFATTKIAKIIMTAHNFDGVGVFIEPGGDISEHMILYMDKLAVVPHARGRGVAQGIIEAADTDGLFWRAAANNSYFDKYVTLSDGHRIVHSAGDKAWRVYWRNVLHKIIPNLIKAADEKTWTVFWRNVPPENIPSLLKYAQSRPVTIHRN
ncbi:TPA: hypothetical protein DIS56_03340 [Candidatus Saccharibacteria bacterium]|nr:MAG: Acetylglutamate kinase [Candidatus Saccharibacteria bacterium GW2011_GWA2_46_10]HCM52136.1 hypothetical protein [Candidatus Saccharibacteria bacterium]